MNTGIQDAANLGWKLAAVGEGADPSLLDTYDAERGAVGELVVRRTSRARPVAFSGNPLLAAIRDTALAVGTSVSKLRERAQAFVSEIAIEYRDSPASVECARDGALRAGDRMPDLDLDLQDGTRASVSTLLRAARPLVLDEPGSGVTVVRPDGYIGFRGGPQHRAQLEAYARLIAL
jgi:hypothetical protein